MLSLLKHELLSRWRAMLGWGVGLALFGAMYISIYPQVSEQMAQISDLAIYEAMGIEMTTFEGYIASVVLSYVALLLGIYAIVTSTKTLAGEEDAGTLELVMAQPLSRWQIVAMKTAGIAVAMFAALVVAAIGDAIVLQAIRSTTSVNVTPLELGLAVIGAWPITMAFVTFGIFLGAFLPSRRIAAIVATVVFVASFFAEGISGMTESLKPIKPFSLFAYFDSTATTFTEGVAVSDVAVLLIVALVFFVLALIGFQRRDVTVGAWPWQRMRTKRMYDVTR